MPAGYLAKGLPISDVSVPEDLTQAGQAGGSIKYYTIISYHYIFSKFCVAPGERSPDNGRFGGRED